MPFASVLSVLFFLLLVPAIQAVGQTAYNEQYARLMLMLSAGAYAPLPEGCVNETSRLSAQPFQLVSQSNTDCDTNGNSCAFFVAVAPTLHQIVIVYRGTKTKKQLLQEFLQALQPNVDFFGHGKVNRYFFRALNALWDSSTSILADPRYRDFSVTFTGHSLGGALASLAAMRVILERMRAPGQVRLYTFGQPRIGNHKFALEHDSLIPESFRIVNRNDVVPHLPLCHIPADSPHLDAVDAVEGAPAPRRDPDPDRDSFNLQEAIRNPCDGTDVKKAYHHGTEIWYPEGMFDGAPYRECLGLPKNEDHSCSNGVHLDPSFFSLQRYIGDHRHYFGHQVSKFGKSGCRAVVEETIERPEMIAGFGATPAPAAGATQRPSGFRAAALGFLDKLNSLRNG
ncbi:Lipase-like protein [Aphelenchoides fujianensis]|nr:Lipase-like protein [Aphelenchoides fujianensis]